MINLYNGDNMEFMKGKPDKYYDLAIVDPPYNWNSGNAFTSRLKKYGDLSYNNNAPTSEYFKELLRVSKNQIIWGGNYFIEHLKNTKCMIIWFKHQPVVTYANCEIAWTSFEKEHSRVFDYPYFGAINSEKDRCHPNQKPVALYEWLLDKYAKKGDKIFDSHGGSMSSAIACYNLGYDLDICELDPEYFKQAKERFNKHTDQIRLTDLIGE